MSDLTKILLSAGIGWAGGLISSILLEPFKTWYLRKFTAKRARTAMYKELAGLYRRLIILGHEMGFDFAEMVLRETKLETFDYFCEQSREAVYQIDEWQELRHLFDAVSIAQKELREGGDEQEIIMELEKEFDRYSENKLIDAKLLQVHIEKLREKRSADLIVE